MTSSKFPVEAALGALSALHGVNVVSRNRLIWWTGALAVLGATGLLTGGLILSSGSPAILLSVTFPHGKKLITNERAYYDPHAAGARLSPVWMVTSGSLFSDDGSGWTGIPDGVSPNVTSSNGTDSAVFRVVTRRSDFDDVSVAFQLWIAGLVTTPRTPAQSYDGVHVFLRYQNQTHLYVVSVYRRDGVVAVKEKIPGGPVNGGTYFTLGEARYRMPLKRWVSVNVSIVTLANDEVHIELFINGDKVLSAISTRSRAAPILAAGRVGLRGDNCQFFFRDFTVSSASP